VNRIWNRDRTGAGVVCDSVTGHPVERAVVRVDIPLGAETTTGPDGNYVIDAFPRGGAVAVARTVCLVA
jgi:hypothetical protein